MKDEILSGIPVVHALALLPRGCLRNSNSQAKKH